MSPSILLIAFTTLASVGQSDVDSELQERARQLAQQFIIADTHIDVPYRLWRKPIDISVRTDGGDFDYPRARSGGLDAVFMSIYTPARLQETGGSKALADSLIDMVEGFAIKWPSKFEMATSVSEVRAAVDDGKIALLLGMENGAPIEGDLRNLRYFRDRGVRYITLTHSKDNEICDSSYDEAETWKGLSPFGKTVVGEMNRLGIMIDVSHISDDAFYQVMELSRAPVIASHSSCRSFTPGFHRNMDDDMIMLLAKKGGVIQINFGSIFIDDDVRRRFYEGRDKAEEWARENGFGTDDEEVREFRKRYYEENPLGFADVVDVGNHIDHVVTLVGVDHVGFGSDFDGVGDSLPTGLKDASYYPNLIYDLLKRGYTDEDIAKICSGNLFRVWEEVDRVASEMSVGR